MSDQPNLNAVLDGITKEINECCPDEFTCNSFTAHYFVRNKAPALVKALRRALMGAKIMPAMAYERITDDYKVDLLPNDLQAEYDTMEQDIAAILQPSSEQPVVGYFE